MLKTITIAIRPSGTYDLRPSIPGACYDVADVPASRLGAEVAALASAGWTTVATPQKIERIKQAGADTTGIRPL